MARAVSVLADTNANDVWVQVLFLLQSLLIVVGGPIIAFVLTRRSGKAKKDAGQAKEEAEKAAGHAEALKETVGVANGNGTLVQMAERLLGAQSEIFAWQRDHDRKDDARDEVVKDIKRHLGMETP